MESYKPAATRFGAANQRKNLEFKQQYDQIKFGILCCFSINEFDIMRCERMQRLYQNDSPLISEKQKLGKSKDILFFQ